MRLLLSLLLILFGFTAAWSQDEDRTFANQFADTSVRKACISDLDQTDSPDRPCDTSGNSGGSSAPGTFVGKNEILPGESVAKQPKSAARKSGEEVAVGKYNKNDNDPASPKEKFHWKPALIQSMAFLGFKHSFRIGVENKTRSQLGGSFFGDWKRSVQGLRGWKDGDNFATNYIAHPMQGAFTGRIYVNNSDLAKKQEFGPSKKYWKSRMKAFAWSAVWSTQFEIGPISEASIGNVGMYKKNGYSTMTYADMVVTPVLGTGLLIGEDAIDKYFLKNWLERKTKNKFKIRLLRSLFTPTTSISNMVRGKVPWQRDERPF